MLRSIFIWYYLTYCKLKMYNITLPLISLLNVHVIESISKWNFSYNPFKILSSFKYTATEDEILIGFHVDDCEYCQEMKTLLRRLELEEGIRVHILDASMPKNLKLLKRLDNGKCGGLPFYYNVKTNRYICGATAYENLLVWATNGVNK